MLIKCKMSSDVSMAHITVLIDHGAEGPFCKHSQKRDGHGYGLLYPAQSHIRSGS